VGTGWGGASEPDACSGFELSQLACLSRCLPVRPSPVLVVGFLRRVGNWAPWSCSNVPSSRLQVVVSCGVAPATNAAVPQHVQLRTVLYAMTAHISAASIRLPHVLESLSKLPIAPALILPLASVLPKWHTTPNVCHLSLLSFGEADGNTKYEPASTRSDRLQSAAGSIKAIGFGRIVTAGKQMGPGLAHCCLRDHFYREACTHQGLVRIDFREGLYSIASAGSRASLRRGRSILILAGPVNCSQPRQDEREHVGVFKGKGGGGRTAHPQLAWSV
jgi:hypothetical protein